jgi:hypothetical protein
MIGYVTYLFQDHSWWARFLRSNILASLSLGPVKRSLIIGACQNVFLTIFSFVGQLIPLIVCETEGLIKSLKTWQSPRHYWRSSILPVILLRLS